MKVNRCFGGTCRLHLRGRRIRQARNQRKTGNSKECHVITQETEIFVHKQEGKSVSLQFCGLILKYWLRQQLHHFKLYYYMRNSGSIKIEFTVLFY
jgi:hypothetical protein